MTLLERDRAGKNCFKLCAPPRLSSIFHLIQMHARFVECCEKANRASDMFMLAAISARAKNVSRNFRSSSEQGSEKFFVLFIMHRDVKLRSSDRKLSHNSMQMACTWSTGAVRRRLKSLTITGNGADAALQRWEWLLNYAPAAHCDSNCELQAKPSRTLPTALHEVVNFVMSARHRYTAPRSQPPQKRNL